MDHHLKGYTMRIQLKAYDREFNLWNHQYGRMWANETYEYKPARGKPIRIIEGRVLRNDRDITWFDEVD